MFLYQVPGCEAHIRRGMAAPERARERGPVLLDRLPGAPEDGGARRQEESTVGRLFETGGVLRAGRRPLGGAQVLHARVHTALE